MFAPAFTHPATGCVLTAPWPPDPTSVQPTDESVKHDEYPCGISQGVSELPLFSRSLTVLTFPADRSRAAGRIPLRSLVFTAITA
jgi:hypothetical protein